MLLGCHSSTGRTFEDKLEPNLVLYLFLYGANVKFIVWAAGGAHCSEVAHLHLFMSSCCLSFKYCLPGLKCLWRSAELSARRPLPARWGHFYCLFGKTEWVSVVSLALGALIGGATSEWQGSSEGRGLFPQAKPLSHLLALKHLMLVKMKRLQSTTRQSEF